MRKYRILAAAAFLVLCAFVGYKVAKACEYVPTCEELNTCEPVEEPTCEELQNCEPETPPVEEPKVSTPDAPKLHTSQGPAGVKGDGTCQLEWKEIKGSKKVEIRIANDGVFGNGFKSFETKDDGAEWVEGITGENAKVKFRGRDSKTEWSKAINLDC